MESSHKGIPLSSLLWERRPNLAFADSRQHLPARISFPLHRDSPHPFSFQITSHDRPSHLTQYFYFSSTGQNATSWTKILSSFSDRSRATLHAASPIQEDGAVTITDVTPPDDGKKQPVWQMDETEVSQLISTLEETDGGHPGVKAQVVTTTTGNGGAVTEVVTTFARRQETETTPRATGEVVVSADDVSRAATGSEVDEIVTKDKTDAPEPSTERRRSKSKEELLKELGEKLSHVPTSPRTARKQRGEQDGMIARQAWGRMSPGSSRYFLSCRFGS